MSKKKAQALSSSLLREGCRFVVQPEPKDGTFSPHSMGFISCYEPNSHSNNVVRANVVMVRKGKGGMERIERQYLLCPVYLVEEAKEIILANKKRYFVFLQRDDLDKYDVRQLDPLHFLGWAVAKIDMLSKVSGWFNKGIGKQPQADLLFQVNRLSMGVFKNDPEAAKDAFASEHRRVQIVDEIRKREAETTRALLQYHRALVNIHVAATHWLRIATEGFSPETMEKTNLLNEEVFAETEKRNSAEMVAIESLIMGHKTKI